MTTIPYPSNDQPDEVIDRLCRELTSDENVIVARDVVTAFDVWLKGHPEVTTRHSASVAATMVQAFFARRRPKVRAGEFAGQLGLFRPEALVPVGYGKKAWMDDLSRDQFTLWRDIETRGFDQTRSVFESKDAYWSERLDVWGGYEKLGALERGEFGWTDTDLGYDDDDSDEDDG